MATATRVQRRKAQTDRAILDAAQSAFLSRGYEATTIEEIAAAADVGVGSIYNHFGNKRELYLAVVERALDADERYMDEAFDPARPPEEQLRAAGTAYLRLYVDYPDYFRLIAYPPAQAEGETSPPAAKRIAERVAKQNGRAAEAIKRGIAEGTMRPVDVDRVVTYLWAALNGAMALAWRADDLRLEPDEIRDVLRAGQDLITWGLRARD
jgi:TetR/AcrR family transcriptional regulator